MHAERDAASAPFDSPRGARNRRIALGVLGSAAVQGLLATLLLIPRPFGHEGHADRLKTFADPAARHIVEIRLVPTQAAVPAPVVNDPVPEAPETPKEARQQVEDDAPPAPIPDFQVPPIAFPDALIPVNVEPTLRAFVHLDSRGGVASLETAAPPELPAAFAMSVRNAFKAIRLGEPDPRPELAPPTGKCFEVRFVEDPPAVLLTPLDRPALRRSDACLKPWPIRMPWTFG